MSLNKVNKPSGSHSSRPLIDEREIKAPVFIRKNTAAEEEKRNTKIAKEDLAAIHTFEAQREQDILNKEALEAKLEAGSLTFIEKLGIFIGEVRSSFRRKQLKSRVKKGNRANPSRDQIRLELEEAQKNEAADWAKTHPLKAVKYILKIHEDLKQSNLTDQYIKEEREKIKVLNQGIRSHVEENYPGCNSDELDLHVQEFILRANIALRSSDEVIEVSANTEKHQTLSLDELASADTEKHAVYSPAISEHTSTSPETQQRLGVNERLALHQKRVESGQMPANHRPSTSPEMSSHAPSYTPDRFQSQSSDIEDKK